jgi:hypothetical protein
MKRKCFSGALIGALLAAASHTLSALGLASAPEERPVGLVALENARAALLTGQIEFSVYTNRPCGTWWDEPRFYTARFGGDDYMLEDRGDREGVVWRGPDGQPHADVGQRPYRWLVHDGKQWAMRDGSLAAEVNLLATDVIDARCFGIVSMLPQGGASLLHERIWRTGDATYETGQTADGLQEVIARHARGNWEKRWLLDPQRGWNPVRVTVTVGGKFRSEGRTSLKKYGDVWFPEVCEIYDHTYKDGREPLYVMRVYSTSFNQPDQPLRFTPEDIGIEVGTSIDVHRDWKNRETVTMGWDGQRLIPREEFRRRFLSGELKKGKRHLAALERSFAMGEDAEDRIQLMTRYTLGFIEQYALDEEQTQKAMSILGDCRKRAESYGASKKEQFERIRREALVVCDDASLSPDERTGKLEPLKQEMFGLERPLQRIYYHELIPRLNRLPTRAQREAAAEREFAAHQKRAAGERDLVEEVKEADGND